MDRIENIFAALEAEAASIIAECDQHLAKFVALMRQYVSGDKRNAPKRNRANAIPKEDKRVLAKRDLAVNLLHSIRDARERFRVAKQDPSSFGYAMFLLGRSVLTLSKSPATQKPPKQATRQRKPDPVPVSVLIQRARNEWTRSHKNEPTTKDIARILKDWLDKRKHRTHEVIRAVLVKEQKIVMRNGTKVPVVIKQSRRSKKRKAFAA